MKPTPLPTPEEVRSRLSLLSHAQMLALAEITAVPFTTLWKIRGGVTMNPRLSTVCAIWPELVKGPRNKRLKQQKGFGMQLVDREHS